MMTENKYQVLNKAKNSIMLMQRWASTADEETLRERDHLNIILVVYGANQSATSWSKQNATDRGKQLNNTSNDLNKSISLKDYIIPN